MAHRSAPVRPIPSSPAASRTGELRRFDRLVRLSRRAPSGGPGNLAARHGALRGKFQAGKTDDVLVPALAHTVEACSGLLGEAWPVLGETYQWDISPRDNQLVAACALASGRAVELATGEGKTVVAAVAAALWALEGRVHLVTANDYLARRDHDWMGPMLTSLGLTVGLVHQGTALHERQGQYQSDITYVSAKELGADYLRDTLNSDRASLNLPGLERAILDEIDFILVDEAGIPLILAEPVPEGGDLSSLLNHVVASLVASQRDIQARLLREIRDIERQPWGEKKKQFEITFRLAELFLADPLAPELEAVLTARADEGDRRVLRRVKALIARYSKTKRRDELLEDLLYWVDHRDRTVALTERGIDQLQAMGGDIFPSGEFDRESRELDDLRARAAAVHNLLSAHVLYHRDRDYIVHQGQVLLIDQPTGRPAFDRQLQHGLHRALEAKEGLDPALDHRAAAEITFPGFFQMYGQFTGLSGTCVDLGDELRRRYELKVVTVPPHRPVQRVDFEDALFLNRHHKEQALLGEARRARQLEQPLLIGTVSVEQSEQVSRLLDDEGIPHQVLNARHHEKEAPIIAAAGQPGAVTVATIMAGRGTDIRPHPDLPQRIAAAAARWMAAGLAEGDRGFRLEVYSEEDKQLVASALATLHLPWRDGRQKARSWLIDVGPNPPATAQPLTLGLTVIGFEHFGAHRLDRQLRGRTGRQGAPGASRFYVSLDEETVLLHGDRPGLAEVRQRAQRRMDPLSGSPRWVHRRLAQLVRQAWTSNEIQEDRLRHRLERYDKVDQQQREHYERERQILLFADDGEIEKLAKRAIARAVKEFAQEFAGSPDTPGSLPPPSDKARLAALDDALHIWFERRLVVPATDGEFPDLDDLTAALEERLMSWYAVTREVHGPVMAAVERTVLLDALTEGWRSMAHLRLELRRQAELFAFARRRPEEGYRTLAGETYHRILAGAARQAASTLVTFPLPREIKTPVTGRPVQDEQVIRLVRSDYRKSRKPTDTSK